MTIFADSWWVPFSTPAPRPRRLYANGQSALAGPVPVGIVRVDQLVRETLLRDVGFVWIDQLVRETLLTNVSVHVDQLVRETLLQDALVFVTTPYPVLKGLGFNWIKRIIGGNTGVAKAASGRESRINYWTYPSWEWDLTYPDYLPDAPANGTTASDLKDLMGFCAANYGSFRAFPFLDPDDNSVSLQLINNGTGVDSTFLLVKSYGLGAFIGTEPIGFLNQSFPFNVYVNGVLKTLGVDYTVNVSLPYTQTITFASPPGAGLPITVDMHYYYMARIKDDSNEFEKFMDKFWSMKKITLMSLKGT